MKQKTLGKLFFQASLSLVLLLSLLYLIVLKDNISIFGLLILVVLLLLSTVGLATYKKCGDTLLFTAFSLHAFTVIGLWLLYDTFYVVLLLFSLLGLCLSRPRRVECEEECGHCEVQPEVSSPPPQKIVDGKIVEAKAKPTTFEEKTSSKYIASKRSNVYHEAKCERAKKIQKARLVLLESREDALNKGYKNHNCVQ